MAQKPLMLKDYLELDSWSDSFWWAPLQRAGGTTVRTLLETEFRLCATDKTGWKLFRSRSKGALARVSAVFKLLKTTTDTAGSGSLLKKLSRNFSMKRGSLFYHSPVVSRCSTSSEVLSSTGSSGDFFLDGKESDKGIFVAAGEESRAEKPEEICDKVDMDCPFEEEKEQLSPVSVMDFLYRDEDEDETVAEQPSTNSISFEQNIVNIERSKNQLLQKIRRFESLANLDPVHLDHHFACTKEEYENETPRWRSASALLRQLSDFDSLPLYGEKLLFDFFVEGYAADEEILRQAAGWAAAGGIAAEQLGHVAVREVERCGGGWKRFAEEEEIVAVEVTGCVVTWLVEELVDDLLVSVGRSALN